MKLLTVGIATLALMGACISSIPAFAHGDEHHDEPSKTQAATAEKATQDIPATSAGIWSSINAKCTELQKTIQSGSLANVHHLAYAIRDLAAALPDRAKSLSADKLGKVKGNLKFVTTLADRLDAAGDSNDKAGAQANYEKLTKVLAMLRADTATSPQ